MIRRAVLVAVALLALAPAAHAATKTVDMGPPASAAERFQSQFVDVNDYFPHRTVIRVGDRVRFVARGFHTAELPVRGTDPLPLISPTGQDVSGMNDAAGQAFWFNGQDQVGFNPVLLRQGFGRSFRYNGTRNVNSGLPLAERVRPMTVRFTRAGTHRVYCNVHPGMEGVVKVKRRGKRSATRRAVRRQVARDLEIARELPNEQIPPNTVSAGVAGRFGVEWFAFAPAKTTVARGATVNFVMDPDSYEVHTATAGPGNPASEPNSYLGQIAAGFEQPVFDPRAAYPSTAPNTGPASLTPALHGNGFWNSGILDTEQATPLPDRSSVRFDAAGVYNLWCLIHPFMRTEITVQ